MKKNIIILPLLALIAGACTNPFDYQTGQPESIIIMNASLRTDQTVHTVWLCKGGITELSGIDDAELTCYINDEFAAKAHLVLTEDERDYQEYYGAYYYARPYEFSAVIKPGDKVRLDASWYGLHASATTYAPQAPVLAALDTVRTDRSIYSAPNDPAPALTCRMRLEDRSGEENWYRICVTYDAGMPAPESDREGEMIRWQGVMPFTYYKDKILNDGFRTPDEGQSFGSLLEVIGTHVYSKYCSFSDKAFDGTSATVEFDIFEGFMTRRALTVGWTDEHPKSPTELRMKIDLQSLSKEAYYHLNALTLSQVSGLDWSPLYEPVRLPNNVQGGLGLVTVASVSSVTLDPVPLVEYPEETGY